MFLLRASLLVVLIHLSCSESGTDDTRDGRIPEDDSDGETADVVDRPDVGFTDLWVDLPPGRTCREGSVPGLETNINPIKIDGRFEDWNESSRLFTDSDHDSRSGSDILSFGMGMDENSIFYRININGLSKSREETIFIEFLTGFKKTKAFEISRKAILAVHRDGLRISFGGPWSEVGSKIAKVVYGSDAIELGISREFLMSGFISFPLWGTRISLGDKEKWLDFSSFVMFQGVDGEGFGFFNKSGCVSDGNRNLSLEYQVFSDLEADELIVNKGVKSVLAAERTLDKYLKTNEYPVQMLPVIIVDEPISFESIDAPEGFFLDDPLDRYIVGLHRSKFRFGLNDIKEYQYETDAVFVAYRHLVDKFATAFYFGRLAPQLDKYLGLVSSAMTCGVLKEIMGLYYWIDMVQDEYTDFSQRVGILIQDRIGTESLVAASLTDTSQKFWDDIASFAEQKGAVDQVEYLMRSFKDGNRESILEDFSDRDNDGLMRFLEMNHGTNPLMRDSDDDGWSDLIEIIVEKKPTSRDSFPGVLAPDGIFSDFTDLIPTKIHNALSQERKCTSIPKVSGYTALLLDNHLMIGVSNTLNQDAEAKASVRWEVDLFSRSTNQALRLVVKSGERRVEVLDQKLNLVRYLRSPFQFEEKSIEIMVRAQDLGLKKFEKDLVLTVSSYRNDVSNALCDRTEGFRPL